jgi:hypothetical protein
MFKTAKGSEVQHLCHCVFQHRVVVERHEAHPFVAPRVPPFNLANQRGIVGDSSMVFEPTILALPQGDMK